MSTIQIRRGREEHFQPLKMLPGELAASTDARKVRIAFAEGDVHELAMQEEVDEIDRQVEEVRANLGAADNDIMEAKETIRTLEDLLGGKVDGAFVSDDGYLYLTSDGQVVIGPLGPFSGNGGGSGGGGGGSSENNAVMQMENTAGWAAETIAKGTSVTVTASWSSLENEIPTGPGTLKVYVNGVVRQTLNVEQGAISVNCTSLLAAGRNSVRLAVSDVYGNSRSVNFTITVADLSMTSSFDPRAPYTGAFVFPFTPRGDVEKTIIILVDGTQIYKEVTTVSGRQLSVTIPAQSHGKHSIEAYFEAEVGGTAVESNHLYFEFACVREDGTEPIITSSYDVKTIEQYGTIAIPYRVYSPGSYTSQITLSVNGTVVKTLTVDRSSQTWSYRAFTPGQLSMAITCGTVTKTFSITVEASSMQIGAVEDSLELYLSSNGRNNAEADPASWTYGSIAAVMTGFNYASDGWQLDKDQNTVLRLSGAARVFIPFRIFENDFRATGKTIELEFSTSAVRNYDTPIITCMSGGRGIQVTAQKALLRSEQKEISTMFKEDEHVRISFVVEKRSENRLIYIYINGVMSGTVLYPLDDDFSQVQPVGITIGSDDCTTDIYCIRVYNNSLTRHQILGNWIADTQNVEEMLSRYKRNNVFDAYDNIVISQLPADLPYLVLTSVKLPAYKGDKVTLSGRYVDPSNSRRSFTFTDAQFDVQGTSSQYYSRKNYKGEFKGGFNTSGGQSDTYQLTESSVPTDTFCFKADVASSEGANNVELVRLYEMACPYKTPAQKADPLIRQGIDGYPIVIFWDDGESIRFMGKYNANLDKGTEECYGLAEGDESWEVKNNTSDRVLFKSADYSGTDWLNDFEGRYPDENDDPEQLAEFAVWVVSTNTDAATGEAIEPVTYGGVEYTTDSADYRLAKFKAESGQYMEMQSVLFYYLFTELFLMVDSRAKNMFPSFIGSAPAVAG